MRKHICRNFCEYLAPTCTSTFNTLRGRHFCLSCDIWLFGQTCKCVHSCMPSTHTHTHTHTHHLNRASISQYTPIHLTPPTTHTHIRSHIHSCGYYQRCSAEAPGLSGPYGVAVTRGGRAYLSPPAPPSAPRIGSGSWEADAMQAPSVACFCGQSV